MTRVLKIELAIQEKSTEPYSSASTVASEEIEIPLPANAQAVGAAVIRHLSGLNSTVNEFRGKAVAPAADAEILDELVLD